MRKVLITVILLVLVGCAAALVFTYQSLGTTQRGLQETKNSLYKTQLELEDTTQSLEETQHELLDTSKSLEKTQQSLEETKQELDEQKSQTEMYIQLHESGLKELQNREEELEALTEEYKASQQANQELEDTINDMKSKLELYEDTLGIQVFSGIMPPYRSGNLPILVLNNRSLAKNPTWNQLEAFLREDKTDKNLYIPGVYECGNYAQELHNNAEAQNIRAAFVAVHFHNDQPHALNAFKTTDKGLVYIDVTGDTKPVPLAHLDKKVILEKDKRYSPTLLFPNGWSITPENRIIKSIEIYW